MKDIEGYVKKENADRKRETQEIVDKLTKEEEKRCVDKFVYYNYEIHSFQTC